jgi:hypothetical protein
LCISWQIKDFDTISYVGNTNPLAGTKIMASAE